ncbi:hypothetical protein [Amycolatopsis carbonis]|uniref:hypothetical protein n=1 Tax=Amycolatopsis carbonis TaxID=715471 RepID=UPI003341D29E
MGRGEAECGNEQAVVVLRRDRRREHVAEFRWGGDFPVGADDGDVGEGIAADDVEARDGAVGELRGAVVATGNDV